MSEETNQTPNPILTKKSQSPKKLTSKDEIKGMEKETNKIINKNMTEQVSNKSKSYLLTGKMTQEFTEEDELENISITYREEHKKIKLITLDLLLRKIIFENFIEKNPIEIFSFCQQCYCFIDKELIFNKIFNCYNFYKEKKLPINQIGNLIKFLNILVIEMYEYYSKLKIEESTISLLKNIYNSIFFEICEFINNEAEEKAGQEENLNINDIQNKLEDYKDEELETNEKSNSIFQDRCSEYQNEDNRERFGTIAQRKDDGRFSSYIEENNSRNEDWIHRNTINLAYKKDEPNSKKDKKDGEKTEKKKKKGLGLLFFHSKKEKDKPIKVEDKNYKEKGAKNAEMEEKFKQIQDLRKGTSSPEEDLLNCIRNIIILFSLEEPKKRDLIQAKKAVDFYKDINKKIIKFIEKDKEIDNEKGTKEPKKRHIMAKSVTVENVTKKHKLKLHENDGFFDVLDWDKKEIGEKLISISKNLVNKVQRREIYKAVFLKKNKDKTSPNVMENIDKFNRLTFFIIQDILSYDFAKDRGKIIDKWIKIADYCKERKDYNDCVAINSALNNYIITGLKKTMNEISKEKKETLKKINKFCRYQGNYKKLREDMKNLNINEFYVPYLGMILKDLAFFEENSKYLENDILINFEKLENVQKAISEFFYFKNTNDRVNIEVPEELNFFDNLEDLKESELENEANKLEPEFKRDTNKQKEKRPTKIDIKYFVDSTVKRPNMRDSKRLSKKSNS